MLIQIRSKYIYAMFVKFLICKRKKLKFEGKNTYIIMKNSNKTT